MKQEAIDELTRAVLSADQYMSIIRWNFVAVAALKFLIVLGAFGVIFLGYRLLVDGIKGGFKFQSQFAGAKADLASVSPGTLFVLLGVLLMCAALFLKFEFPVEQSIRVVPATGPIELPPVAPLPETDPFPESKL